MPVRYDDFESSLMSDEVNEVLGTMPAFILRWGNMLLLMIILLLLLLSGFVSYPDIMSGKAIVAPVIAPAAITVDKGTVKALYVSNGQLVRKGQPLFQKTVVGNNTTADTVLSPAYGKVVFERVIDSMAVYNHTTLLMSIQPEKVAYVSTVTLPSAGTGKIQIGQQVAIHLNNYPSREFGNLVGTVLSKPLPAGDGIVSVDVLLSGGNVTTFHKVLDIYKEMDGQAEVVTTNKRLIQRILSFLN
ncbi:hypothetical protein ACE38W_06960 [Chitinophaga sp. Hz27]|uniref:hypothetical protein n=1 Tax=Chitinophaga sp. Hz27 TaxID=3347169 RepID=UPI0035DD54CE